MADIKNEAEMLALLERVTTEIIQEVSQQVLGDLRISIRKFAYNDDPLGEGIGQGIPNRKYLGGEFDGISETQITPGLPSGEFLDSWEFTPLVKTVNTITATLFNNWETMEFDADQYKHGSKLWGDARQFLQEILNERKEAYSGWTSSWAWKYIAYGYWDEFIKEMYDKGKISKYFRDAANKRNLTGGFIIT
jgi:hypothetical protein